MFHARLPLVAAAILSMLALGCPRERPPEPERPAPGADAALICVGAGHACFVDGDGELLCAGRNLDGQLGDGSHVDHTFPVAAGTLRGVDRLACGDAQTCAVVDGALHCWGRNDRGQLGVGDREPRATPTRVAGLANVVDVALGPDFGCALTAEGSLHCWGAHEDGRLGTARTEDALAPARVEGVAAARSVDVGAAHGCVAVDDGRALCWGRNDRGQLGDGQRTSRPTPRPVVGVAAVTRVAAGGDTSCVLSGGTASCFGANDHGQLGDGHAGAGFSSPRPVAVARLARIEGLALSTSHACARVASGKVACWGDGRRGELGRGGFEPFAFPVEATNAADAVAVAVGEGASCLRRRDHALACFGQNRYGAFGNGSVSPNVVAVNTVGHVDQATRDRAVPALVPGTRPSLDQPALVMGDAHVCVLARDGSVRCAGSSADGRLGHGSTVPPGMGTAATVLGLDDAVELSAQGASTCARRADGGLACWGRSEGSLGVPGVRSSSAPIAATTIASVSRVAVGRGFVCGLRGDGTVACWGENGFGQLGSGDTTSRESAAPVLGLAEASALSAGRNFVCALHGRGAVWCWGDGGRGQLGDGRLLPSSLPVAVAGLTDAVSIAAHDEDACAVRRNGAVVCWGRTAVGAHPDELPGSPFAARPVALPGIRAAASVAVGSGFACILGRDGSVSCMGRNVEGQAGVTPRGAPLVSTPTRVLLPDPPVDAGRAPAGDPAIAIAAGQLAACALRQSGAVFCWGSGPLFDDRRPDSDADPSRPSAIAGLLP